MELKKSIKADLEWRKPMFSDRGICSSSDCISHV